MSKFKIGFVDYFLDNWHACNYPEMINRLGNEEYEIVCAYAKIDSPNGGMTTDEWCEKYGIRRAASIEEVVEESDFILVLSPAHPEMHEELSQIPLKSGKPVYIDKTFAPDKETAKRIFDLAEKHNTPCFSSSALAFSSEFQDLPEDKPLSFFMSFGGGSFDVYIIHSIEPMLMNMGSGIKRVMCTGTEARPVVVAEFEDGRCGYMMFGGKPTFAVSYEKGSAGGAITSPYFENLIVAILKFFQTKEIPLSHQHTIDVMGTIQAAIKAKKTPYTWVEV